MKTKSENITPFAGAVTRNDRELLHGHNGFLVWFTGLSASGKSTIGSLLEARLHAQGYSTFILDGDNVRHGLCADLGFSPEDRTENIRRIGEVGKLLVDAGIIVITALISPYRADRQKIRDLFPAGEFIEAFTKCSVDACASRDVKGLYKKAISGEIPEFTGISAPYEEPENPEIILDTENESAIEGCARLIEHLKKNGCIPTDFESRQKVLRI